MQEQDKEFKIGQKVRYLGGDAHVDLYTGKLDMQSSLMFSIGSDV